MSLLLYMSLSLFSFLCLSLFFIVVQVQLSPFPPPQAKYLLSKQQFQTLSEGVLATSAKSDLHNILGNKSFQVIDEIMWQNIAI